jgi:hypothetical protein
MHMHMHKHMHMHMQANTDIDIDTHTHIHINTHTHTHSCVHATPLKPSPRTLTVQSLSTSRFGLLRSRCTMAGRLLWR